MWDLPRPGLEPMSPALAGRFSTTAPPGKPLDLSKQKEKDEIYTYRQLIVIPAPYGFCFPTEMNS